jgi:ATP adenylyltransferase
VQRGGPGDPAVTGTGAGSSAGAEADIVTDVGPDGLQRLWMPHRLAYIKGENKPADGGAANCPFCEIPKMSDRDGLIVARGTLVYAVLNLYPYNSGHLMVVPYRHVADYTELTEPETAELADFTKRAMTALRDASQAQGFNIGMNMGNVAGAGISAHLHQHVVPRWGGDANFMPVVARTKVLPQLLADTRVVLAGAWRSG